MYVITADSAPVALGSNVNEFVQLAPAANGFAQVEADLTNELAPLPVIVVEAVKLNAVVPVFVSVTTCAAVVVPTAVEAKVNELGVMLSVGAPAAPVPDSATVCGDPAAVSVYVITADNAPEVVGSNANEFVQLAPAGNGFVHVEAVLLNELAPLPVIVVVAVKLTAVVPVFLIVTTCAAVVVPTGVEAKLSDAGLNVSAGPVEAPVPDSATVCGDPAAVSVYVITADSAPDTVGSNVNEFVQLAPAANGFVQVEADLTNELAPLPVIVVDAVKLTAVVPVFLIVTTCAAVVVPTGVDAKLSELGVMLSADAPPAPVPDSATVCGDPVAVSV